jgi:hypothetical protein
MGANISYSLQCYIGGVILQFAGSPCTKVGLWEHEGAKLSSNENWVRDQVVAAHEKIERDKRRRARYDANFKKASQRALDRIGAFFTKELGTQSIDELAALPKSRTDAAFSRFSASFENEINELREKEGIKRALTIVIGLVAIVAGVLTLAAKGMFLVIGGLVVLVGLSMVIGAFGAFPRTPNALSANQDLFLALRCQQIAEALRKRVNDKRADLGL